MLFNLGSITSYTTYHLKIKSKCILKYIYIHFD